MGEPLRYGTIGDVPIGQPAGRGWLLLGRVPGADRIAVAIVERLFRHRHARLKAHFDG